MRKNAKKKIKAVMDDAAIIAKWYQPSSGRVEAVELTPDEAYSLYIGWYKDVNVYDDWGDGISLVISKHSGTNNIKVYSDEGAFKASKEYHKVDWTQEEYDAMVTERDKARAEYKKQNSYEAPEPIVKGCHVVAGESVLGAFATEEQARKALEESKGFYDYWAESASVQMENTKPVVIDLGRA